MVRLAGIEASPELSEIADYVARGEEVWVELENGQMFLAVAAREKVSAEEWCNRIDSLAGKYAQIIARSADLIQSRREAAESEQRKGCS